MQPNSLFSRLGGSPFAFPRDFHEEKWRPHLLLAICLQSLPWGTLHLENDQSSERFASQSLQASRIIVVTNTTRLPSSAQRVVAFLFPSRGLFLWNSQKKVDWSSHAFTAVWLIQTKGHAKLLWTLIMSNLLLLWWKWQDLVPPPSSPHLLSRWLIFAWLPVLWRD